MPFRVGGALALVAVALLAVAIAMTPWWQGHPSVDGKDARLVELEVGLFGGERCNTGGDGTCQKLPLGGGFKTAQGIEAGAIAITMVIGLALGGLALTASDKRRLASRLAMVGGGVVMVMAIVLLAMGIDVARVTQSVSAPLAPGGFLALVGGALSIAAGAIGGRAASLQTRRAQVPEYAAAPPTAPQPFDVHALLREDVRAVRPSVPNGGMAPGPTTPQAPLFSSAPQLRPLYEMPGAGYVPPQQPALPIQAPPQMPRGGFDPSTSPPRPPLPSARRTAPPPMTPMAPPPQRPPTSMGTRPPPPSPVPPARSAIVPTPPPLAIPTPQAMMIEPDGQISAIPPRGKLIEDDEDDEPFDAFETHAREPRNASPARPANHGMGATNIGLGMPIAAAGPPVAVTEGVDVQGGMGMTMLGTGAPLVLDATPSPRAAPANLDDDGDEPDDHTVDAPRFESEPEPRFEAFPQDESTSPGAIPSADPYDNTPMAEMLEPDDIATSLGRKRLPAADADSLAGQDSAGTNPVDRPSRSVLASTPPPAPMVPIVVAASPPLIVPRASPHARTEIQDVAMPDHDAHVPRELPADMRDAVDDVPHDASRAAAMDAEPGDAARECSLASDDVEGTTDAEGARRGDAERDAPRAAQDTPHSFAHAPTMLSTPIAAIVALGLPPTSAEPPSSAPSPGMRAIPAPPLGAARVVDRTAPPSGGADRRAQVPAIVGLPPMPAMPAMKPSPAMPSPLAVVPMPAAAAVAVTVGVAAPPPSASASSSKLPISTAPQNMAPPVVSKTPAPTAGPSPACPQCEAPMAWVEEHLRFYCKSCKMYF